MKISTAITICDYFDAECYQRSLKRFEKVLHKKNKSKSSKLYSMFAILQCHALKVLWWSHSLKNFMPPLLLESWFKTEAGGGICSDVVRVSPIWHYRTLSDTVKQCQTVSNSVKQCQTVSDTVWEQFYQRLELNTDSWSAMQAQQIVCKTIVDKTNKKHPYLQIFLILSSW